MAGDDPTLADCRHIGRILHDANLEVAVFVGGDNSIPECGLSSERPCCRCRCRQGMTSLNSCVVGVGSKNHAFARSHVVRRVLLVQNHERGVRRHGCRKVRVGLVGEEVGGNFVTAEDRRRERTGTQHEQATRHNLVA